MADLELKYGVIQECIYKIQKLPDRYPAAIRTSVSGEGQGVAEIEQLADLYASFYGAWERLTEETAKYLDRMLMDFKEMDESKAGR